MSHALTVISSQRRIGVFWDLSSCRISRAEDIQMLISELQGKVGTPEFIKSFGDSWGKWEEVLPKYGILCIHKPGIKTFEALLLDLSISLNSGLTHILVISSQSQAFIPHLLQLKSNSNSVEFWLSPRIFPLQIQENLKEELKIPKNSQLEVLANYLKDEAFKGNVLVEYMEFVQIMANKLKIDIEESGKLLEVAEKNQLIFISCKDFDKVAINFVSLKIELVSLECLTWTLRSLCVDEMLPSEKAIQSRMREVFDCKPSPSEWQNLLQLARGHSYSNSAPTEFSFFSKSPSVPKFMFQEITEQSNGCKTILIYPSGEKWQALDNQSKFCDFLQIKETGEWKDFLKFLEAYFSPKGIRRPKKEEEQKSIPGGRYGCAQLLKVCGPFSLRGFSLGKLSYMVQLAINEDYLRYQRTLLIWTSNNQGGISQADKVRKLQIIKQTIISLLEKAKEGISLAQLPLHLKRSLAFPIKIPDLGFAKLKDLLATIPEVSIELRDSNHPFAVFRKLANYTPHRVETILKCASFLLEENKFGLAEAKLEALLMEKLGKIEWGVYRMASLSEFVHSFGRDQFEFFTTNNSQMIFKSKQLAYSHFYEPLREFSWDSMNDRAISPTIPSNHCASYSVEGQVPGHLAKIVNISNLPYEIMKESEEPNYFFESYNDNSTDLSSSLPNIWKGRKSDLADGHNKTQSEEFGVKEKYHKNHYSWLGSDFKAPGFGNVNNYDY